MGAMSEISTVFQGLPKKFQKGRARVPDLLLSPATTRMDSGPRRDKCTVKEESRPSADCFFKASGRCS
jgi:hypothetical protein